MPASTPRSIRVLLVDADERRAATWAAALDAAGARVHHVRDLASALRAPLSDRAVLACDLPDGTGLDLLSELRTREHDLLAVLVTDRSDHATTRVAWRAGAFDLCTAEERPEPVVERLLAAPRRASDRPADSFELRVEQVGEERALRELGALALRAGLPPAARARLLTAAAEAIDNAQRHAYPRASGPIDLCARAHPGGLWVSVRDGGRGCDASAAELESTSSALPGQATPGGLARMRALVESFRFESRPDGGAEVELVVRDHGVALDAGTDSDLSDLDYLSPTRARRLLLGLIDPTRPEPSDLPPALAAIAGRFLGCTSNDRRARRALWN